MTWDPFPRGITGTAVTLVLSSGLGSTDPNRPAWEDSYWAEAIQTALIYHRNSLHLALLLAAVIITLLYFKRDLVSNAAISLKAKQSVSSNWAINETSSKLLQCFQQHQLFKDVTFSVFSGTELENECVQL